MKAPKKCQRYHSEKKKNISFVKWIIWRIHKTTAKICIHNARPKTARDITVGIYRINREATITVKIMADTKMSKYVLYLEVASVGIISPGRSVIVCTFLRYSRSISRLLKNKVIFDKGGFMK